MPLSQARHAFFFDSPVWDNYLFGPCDLHMSISGRFLARRRMFSVDSCANVPAGLLCTGQGLTCARAVNMRAVDAATFTKDVVIESLLSVLLLLQKSKLF